MKRELKPNRSRKKVLFSVFFLFRRTSNYREIDNANMEMETAGTQQTKNEFSAAEVQRFFCLVFTDFS